MRPVSALLLVLALAAPALAGCVATPTEGTVRAAWTDPGESDDRMSAAESVTDSSGRAAGLPGREFAERVHSIEGRIALESLPATLATVNGDVRVRPGAEGEWRLLVTLRATASSAERARVLVDSMNLSWAHEDGGRHFVDARVLFDERRLGAGESRAASIVLTMPASVLYSTLEAETTNGDVAVDGVRVGELVAESTNGDVTATATEPASVRMRSTNGDVALALRPAALTDVALETVNGDVDCRVPEGEDFGYDAVAESTNGDAEVRLSDGSSTKEKGWGSSEATFRSHDYDGRASRTRVVAESVNGDAVVRPL